MENAVTLPTPDRVKNVKLIALDVDGTLLNSHHKLTQKTISVIREISKKVSVIIATGKTELAIRKTKEALSLPCDSPSINLNGLAVYRCGLPLVEHFLEANVASSIGRYCLENDYDYVVYCGNTVWCEVVNEIVLDLENYNDPTPVAHHGLGDALENGHVKSHKIIIMTKPENMQSLRSKITGALDLSNCSMVQALPHMLEFGPAPYSKATALSYYADTQGIKSKEILAMGDGENDLEMLKFAGFGICMGNAMDSVKEACEYRTRSNDEDGVAFALEYLFGNGE